MVTTISSCNDSADIPRYHTVHVHNARNAQISASLFFMKSGFPPHMHTQILTIIDHCSDPGRALSRAVCLCISATDNEFQIKLPLTCILVQFIAKPTS